VFIGVKSTTLSVWPPPAPPEYVDQTQLPPNLPPSSLSFQRRRQDEEVNNDDDSEAVRPATDAAPAQLMRQQSSAVRPTDAAPAHLMRQQSSGSEAGPVSTARANTDHAQTSEHDDRRHGRREFYASSETDGQLARRHSDTSQDKEAGHQLKRSSSIAADDQEPGVQAKRVSDVGGRDGSQPVTTSASSHAVMDVDRYAGDESGLCCADDF